MAITARKAPEIKVTGKFSALLSYIHPENKAPAIIPSSSAIKTVAKALPRVFSSLRSVVQANKVGEFIPTPAP